MSNRTPGSSGSSGPPWVLIGVVAVVAIAAIMATFIAVAGGDDSDIPDLAASPGEPGQVAAVGIDGDPLPRHGSTPDPAEGMIAPPVRGQQFDGTAMTIDPGDGRAKMIVFVAHWCPHCQAEVPVIQDWLDEGNLPDEVDIYAVSTDVNKVNGNYPPSSWLESEGWTVPTMADDTENRVAAAYGLSGYPFFVALDATGAVVFRGSGELEPEQLTAIADALAGTGADDLDDVESDESTEVDEEGNPVTTSTAPPE